MDLPDPICELGYPDQQLEGILGDRYTEFCDWMNGQTMGFCTGYTYDRESDRNIPSHCGPHGVAAYPWDLKRFLARHPVVD